MFFVKDREIKELRKQVSELKAQLRDIVVNGLPEHNTIEEKLKAKEFKDRCLKSDVCPYCGEELYIYFWYDGSIFYNRVCKSHGIVA